MAGHRRESFAARRERRAAIDDPEVVLNAAARYLEARSRSIHEVRRHLASAGYRPDLVEATIERLRSLGMLNDESFARVWVESRDRARPRSESALRRELALKGVERDLADELLEERRARAAEAAAYAGESDVAGPDAAAAERLLSKKMPALRRVADPRDRARRAYALLARNGFDPDTARQAIGRVLAQNGEPDPED